ncbi:MAG: SDR family oxidoreductase [Chitinophagaceae bacterium]|nr:SDR family oxidoreductase [Chitinophagaceae bacterium]MDP1763542.1 SDR family oxidoreductase [Sediminibacterium sp.]MDP1811279.1 SDR family oxidoreductase [Sediminibacterium sp.]MDP3128014.1 SDR family oxidoreductase [Sediminibacterium sp.]MDP3667413.1 SDR family oxidoreductase [Sediminibacterium sp.]
MEKIFEGRVAIVTGGSFGIGRATAVAFAMRGAKVVIADCMVDKENETLSLIKNAGGDAMFIQCDVSDSFAVKDMIEKVIARFGRIDYAFNNAGIEGLLNNTHECTEANWDKTLSINLKGVWLCMKYEIQQMLKVKKGVIINCASVAGLNGFAGLPAYTASKHGIVGLTRSAALEYAKQGIRINAVCPGVIHTPMIDRITGKDKEVEKIYIGLEPIGRMGNPEEVAEAVVWLCSDAASFVTGIAMPVDGGFTAG